MVILTARHSVADDMALVTRQGLLRRMAQAGIECRTLTQPVWDTERFETGQLAVRHVYSGLSSFIEDVALLTYSTPRARNDGLKAELQARAPALPVDCIGDCASPRDMLAATSEGHALGRAL